MTPLSLSVPAAARLIGVGRTTMSQMLLSNELPSIKVGRRRLVPYRALEEFVAHRAKAKRPPSH